MPAHDDCPDCAGELYVSCAHCYGSGGGPEAHLACFCGGEALPCTNPIHTEAQ